MKNKIIASILSLVTMLTLPSINSYAADKTLNVQAYMTTSETSLYGVPTAFNTRLPLAQSGVYAFYRALAGISVNININTANGGISTYSIDTCKNYNYNTFDSICSCSSNCSNNGPYHHTNINLLRKEWIDTVTLTETNRVNMLITPIHLCSMDTEQYTGNTTHNTLRGRFFPTDNKIILQDFDFAIEGIDTYRNYDICYLRAIMIHEIGHMYGTEDHAELENDDDRDYCLWGHYKETTEVVENLSICDNCYNDIVSNASRYNHS